MKPISALLILMIVFFTGGCGTPPGTLPTISMKIGEKTFEIEIAKTADQQETGLMKRDSMPDDHGMIFVFPDNDQRSFWMKNTRIPLDIIFLDAGGTVVSIHQMVAYDTRLTPSDFPCRYAIELNKDAAASAKLKVGDRIVIPDPALSK